MHAQAREFVERALAQYGDVTGRVVEFGSRNANGGVRDLFPHAASYLGIDVHSGPGVDLVCDAANWRPEQGFACVITTETFEHTARWREMLAVGASALAPDGVMLVTCATGARMPHSATVANKRPQPGEYYANVSAHEFQQAVEVLGLQCEVTIDSVHHDLYAVVRPKPPRDPGIRIIGAGLWRTGTVSLKSALQKLTGQPSHHMSEVMRDPRQVKEWLAVVKGAEPQWADLLRDYGSTLDWPSMAYWQQLSRAYPRALVLLSTRDPEEWWQSITRTVLVSAPSLPTIAGPWDELVVQLFERHFVGRFPTRKQAIEAYVRHNELVRHTVAPHRLLEWEPSDGWGPLCRALHVAVPPVPFPWLNTTTQYRRNHRLDLLPSPQA